MFALNARSINIQSFGTEVSTEKNNVALRFCSFFLRRLDNIPRRLQDGQMKSTIVKISFTELQLTNSQAQTE